MTNSVSLVTSINVQSSSGVTALGSSYQTDSIVSAYVSTSHILTNAVATDIMSLTKAYYVYIRVISGSFQILLSSTDGVSAVTDQDVPVDSILVIKSHARYITDIKASGTGELELILGGE